MKRTERRRKKSQVWTWIKITTRFPCWKRTEKSMTSPSKKSRNSISQIPIFSPTLPTLIQFPSNSLSRPWLKPGRKLLWRYWMPAGNWRERSGFMILWTQSSLVSWTTSISSANQWTWGQLRRNWTTTLTIMQMSSWMTWGKFSRTAICTMESSMRLVLVPDKYRVLLRKASKLKGLTNFWNDFEQINH